MREITRMYGGADPHGKPSASNGIQAGHRALVSGKSKVALAHYEAAIQAHPHAPDLWHNLAAALTAASSDHVTSLTAAARAAALDPTNPNVIRNYGSMLHRVGHTAAARQVLHRALELSPDYITEFDLALLEFAEGRFEESCITYGRALRQAPEGPYRDIISFYSAYPALALGDYKHGLELYEGRFIEVAKTAAWEIGQFWQGEDLEGKHLLWHHDQGDGDTLHFCRWLPELAGRGTRITAAVPRRLMRLMKVMPGVEVVDIDGDLPAADYHSPGTSYMRFLDHRYPHWTGKYFHHYLGPNLNIQFPKRQFKIGLNWSARQTDYGKQKSVPLELLIPLAEDPRVNLYSFQVANNDIDRLGAGPLVYNLAGLIRDWQDTADLMGEMDLVISVDSGPAHLAGALGLPTACLVPYRGCWRWGAKTAVETGWYPTMRLIRQRVPGNWDKPVAQLRRFVTEMIDNHEAAL